MLAEVPKEILRKLERARRGPYSVASHSKSGTATTQKSPCAAGAASTRRAGPSFEQQRCRWRRVPRRWACGGPLCGMGAPWARPLGEALQLAPLIML